MKTYDRNRNAIATGSMVMIAGNGTTGVIKACLLYTSRQDFC